MGGARPPFGGHVALEYALRYQAACRIWCCSKMRGEALVFAGRHLLKGRSVMDRLGEITVPTLVLTGRDDFVFPPLRQSELAVASPHARLQSIDRTGHSPHAEQTAEVMAAVRVLISA